MSKLLWERVNRVNWWKGNKEGKHEVESTNLNLLWGLVSWLWSNMGGYFQSMTGQKIRKTPSYIRIWIPLIPTMRCMGKTFFFSLLLLFDPPPPPNPGPNIERTKLSPKPQQCPRLCNHLKWKSRYSFINNTDRWRWKYLRRQCHTASPPTKQQAALTRSENCCFAMQTRCFLRIRAVGLGKKTDCCFVLFCFFSLPSFSHELQ